MVLVKRRMKHHKMLQYSLTAMIILGGIPAAQGGLGVPFFSWLGGSNEPPPATGENLIQAVLEGDLEKIKDLVARGADVNAQYGTPLGTAALKGRLDIVKFLLEAGANPDGSDESHLYTGAPLKAAAKGNHLDIVNTLLDAGATVNMGKYSRGILEGAAENGHLEAIKRLLDAGADPNHSEGYALLLAANEGHLDIVNAFIEAGADVNEGNGWIITNGAKGGNVDVVKAIMKAGANKDDFGSALVRAASKGHVDIVKLLLESGTDPSYGQALKEAAEYGDAETVRALLEAGSVIKYDEPKGGPLHYAAIEGHPDIVALLVEFGADINRGLNQSIWWDVFTPYSDNYGEGWTVMHVAGRWGQPMIGKLVELGADIDLPDAKGYTPLQIAVKYEKLFVVQEMLKLCADVTPTNEEGKTAFDLAVEVHSRNASNTTEYKALMNKIMEVMPERINSSPDNDKTIKTLRDEFQSMMESNSTLKEQMKEIRTLGTDIYTAIAYLFEVRNRRDIIKAVGGHNCKMSMQDEETVAIGTEYLAKCECISGEGPKITLTEIMDENPQCGNMRAVQEDITTETSIHETAENA